MDHGYPRTSTVINSAPHTERKRYLKLAFFSYLEYFNVLQMLEVFLLRQYLLPLEKHVHILVLQKR